MASQANAWLAAIVENSNDAIISKTLDGVITTWNRGAEQLFGYQAEEAVGQPITMLIPDERLSEEEEILSRLRTGQKIDHFETVRRRKDGALIEISVTVSPVTDETGTILGASKIARDIGAQKRAFIRQSLLLREMHHRIKNLFTLTAGLVSLSARATTGGEAFASDLHARLRALARAHELTMPDLGDAPIAANATTVRALLDAILTPHASRSDMRISITGCDAPLAGNALTSMALLLHELTTNAAKYGALSVPEGHLAVDFTTHADRLLMAWTETNGPATPAEDRVAGFGSTLESAAVAGVEGELRREWRADGLAITLEVPLRRLAG
ncbi:MULTISPECIES: PAS domain S-box protein [Paracoccus]|uniref:PAS domain S-box protein n=1 Tax=Paracoccus TaxID=265 RepID=UPI001FB808BB|nr:MULTISPECIES: PAS domain S-box protein [Paracoccus]MCJ1903058.1 PAS domain S-box protein [Paracoccus versutus]MDF3907590.1 PAS domain S-box protein [Paracoccus sp. AS002]